MTNRVKNSSPYATYYDISIDRNNIVHEIYGSSELINLGKCQDVREKLTSELEAKNQIEFGQKSLNTNMQFAPDKNNITGVWSQKIEPNVISALSCVSYEGRFEFLC